MENNTSPRGSYSVRHNTKVTKLAHKILQMCSSWKRNWDTTIKNAATAGIRSL